jgi:hypothetical protein
MKSRDIPIANVETNRQVHSLNSPPRRVDRSAQIYKGVDQHRVDETGGRAGKTRSIEREIQQYSGPELYHLD